MGHIDLLFETLIAYMNTTPNLKCRQEALRAVSSVLNAAGKKSVTYYESLFTITRNIIMSQCRSEEELQVLACAITCLSNLVFSMEEPLQQQLLGNLGEVNGRILECIKV